MTTLAKLLGHASLTTTEIYIAGADPQVRAAYHQAMQRREQDMQLPPMAGTPPQAHPPPPVPELPPAAPPNSTLAIAPSLFRVDLPRERQIVPRALTNAEACQLKRHIHARLRRDPPHPGSTSRCGLVFRA